MPSGTTGAASASRVVLGLDVGGTKVAGRAFSLDAPTVALASQVEPTPVGPTAILDMVASVAKAVIADPAVAQAGGVVGAGVGMPGLVSSEGVLRFAPNLPGVVDLDVRAELEQRIELPLVVDNDANCAAWCEVVLGAAKGCRNVLAVTLGTGIGGGIVLDGQLFRGAHGFAGEPGHMVVDPEGPDCPCGRRGCWERYGSGSGLGWLGRRAAGAGRLSGVLAAVGGDVEAIRGEAVTHAALDGDREAIDVMEELAWWVALGLANLVNVLDVERVVVGGGLARAGDLLVDAIDESFQGQVLAPRNRPTVPVLRASFGPEAGAIGAGLLAPVP